MYTTPNTMKKQFTTTASIIGALALLATPVWAEGEAIDCKAVAKAVETDIKADASKVLAVVAIKVKETPQCACDIVKAAIKATKASNELTGQIVEAAVRAAPDQYKVIVECAVAVNAEAAAEIRAALLRVFGGKDGKGGKVVVIDPATMTGPKTKPWTAPMAVAYILAGIDNFVVENTPPDKPKETPPPTPPKEERPPRKPPFGGGGATPGNPVPVQDVLK